MSRLLVMILIIGVVPVFISSAMAGDREDVDTFIRESMETALAIAKDPKRSAESKREELRAMVLKIFDFEQISIFTLGKFSAESKSDLGEYADRRFSKDQQKEFQELFTKNLGKTYLDRLEFKNVDVKIDLQPAEILKPKKGMKRARVNSIVNDKTPVDYMMLKRNDIWQAYDVRVEGRSLVSAFRKEYYAILATKKPSELLQMLRDKIAENDPADDYK